MPGGTPKVGRIDISSLSSRASLPMTIGPENMFISLIVNVPILAEKFSTRALVEIAGKTPLFFTLIIDSELNSSLLFTTPSITNSGGKVNHAETSARKPTRDATGIHLIRRRDTSSVGSFLPCGICLSIPQWLVN